MSNLDQEFYQPCLYLGNSPDAYNSAFYSHEFKFAIIGSINDNDAVNHFDDSVPLLEIGFTANNFTSNVNYWLLKWLK